MFESTLVLQLVGGKQRVVSLLLLVDPLFVFGSAMWRTLAALRLRLLVSTGEEVTFTSPDGEWTSKQAAETQAATLGAEWMKANLPNEKG